MYTTIAKVQALLGTTIPAGRHADVEDFIEAVTAYIDKYTGRTFTSVQEDRYFDAYGSQSLLVDSFTGEADVSLLDSNGDVVTNFEASEFREAPYNTRVKDQLVILGGWNWSNYGARFGRGRYRVKVNAKWGAGGVPADISMAATKMVADLYLNGGEDGSIQSESLGDYSVTYSMTENSAAHLGVTSVLDMYRDISI